MLFKQYKLENGLPSLKNNNQGESTSNCFRMNPMSVFHNMLTGIFYKLGKTIAQYPSYFIIIPIFLSLLGMTGFQRAVFEEDPEKLYYPSGGSAPYEREVIESNFPINYSSTFLPYHMTRTTGFTRILIKSKDNQTIFRKSIWDEILLLDSTVMALEIEFEGEKYKYVNMCAIWRNECVTNEVLELEEYLPEIENGSLFINYPMMVIPFIVPMFFGGMTINETGGYIEAAEATVLNYFLRQTTKTERDLAMIWEKEIIDLVMGLEFQNIQVSLMASRSAKDLLLENTDVINPYIWVIVIVITIFALASLFTSDWVRSKMMLGLIGVIVVVLAAGTAFGTLIYLGVPMTGVNRIIIFLVLGIGLDDMYVVLASWRRTRLQDSIVKRLAETYSEAGVSITITSLTNVISFSVGISTPIRVMQLFCAYTAFSLFLTYCWHLTLFGGCLAVAGYMENSQRHNITCFKVNAKSDSENRRWYSFWCAGGIKESDPWNPKDNTEHSIMVFFRDYFGKLLTKKPFKGVVLICFLVYMGGAIYGCTKVTEGLDRKKTVRDDSYAVEYFDMEDKLFRQFPYSIQVVITGNITYSDPKTQTQIVELVEKFENSSYIVGGLFTQSILNSYYNYLRRAKRVAAKIHTEVDFIKILKKRYYERGLDRRFLDVRFNDDSSKILASRFIFQAYDIKDTNADKDMMLSLRQLAEESPFNVTVFTPNFILFDQYVVVRPTVIQATLFAAIAMVLVSLLFIPSLWCSLLVGLSIVSIEIGVIGYMSMWDVSVDPISMVNLIMCIGFSVDFSAHISYAYLSSTAATAEERIRECLFCLGLPIIQGAVSTILCIVAFVFAPSYAYVAFFKVVFLVVSLAGLHGLVFIPVLLSTFEPDSFKLGKSDPKSLSALKDPVSVKSWYKHETTIKRSGKSHPIQIERMDPEGASNHAFKLEESSSNTENGDLKASEDVVESTDENTS